MAIDKQHILNEIKRVAKANGGKSPGILRFKSDTGIKKSDWYPHHWLRWGDALREAGFSPNEMEIPWTPEALLEKYIGLIKKLGHFPLEGEVRRQSKIDPTFPSHTSFGRFGGRVIWRQQSLSTARHVAGSTTSLMFVQRVLTSTLVWQRSKKSCPMKTSLVSCT